MQHKFTNFPIALWNIANAVLYLTFHNVESLTTFSRGIQRASICIETTNGNTISTAATSNCRFRHGASSLQAKQQLGEFETLNIEKTNSELRRNVRLHDFSGKRPIAYQTMWDIQKELVNDHVGRLKVEFEKKTPEPQFMSTVDHKQIKRDFIEINEDGNYRLPEQRDGNDAIILLQHEPVYTLGTGSDPGFIKKRKPSSGGGLETQRAVDIVRTERGGEVTYHGPGQLVAYPILDLRGYKQDIHWYMRALEEAILIALRNLGIDATREEDVTGVWVNNKKIAALGVKVRRWVTMHGLAVNVDKRSIDNFNGIVPCGLVGRDVCCINDFVEEPITVEEFSIYLREALETVFEIKLVC